MGLTITCDLVYDLVTMYFIKKDQQDCYIISSNFKDFYFRDNLKLYRALLSGARLHSGRLVYVGPTTLFTFISFCMNSKCPHLQGLTIFSHHPYMIWPYLPHKRLLL